jgi:hypothetical protein
VAAVKIAWTIFQRARCPCCGGLRYVQILEDGGFWSLCFFCFGRGWIPVVERDR